MSLFPAYPEQNQTEQTNENINQLLWLENPSFSQNAIKVINTEKQNLISSDSVENVSDDTKTYKEPKKKRKKCKDKNIRKVRNKSTHVNEPDIFDNNNYCIDTSPDKMYLIIPFIPKQNCPKYVIPRMYVNRNKRKKHKRYFRQKHNFDEKKENGANGHEENEKKFEETENSAVKQEEDLSKTTAFYNRSLDEAPHDVSLWLKYTHFQDVIYQFERIFKRGSHVKGARVTAERKLAILDKALTYNSESEELLRERVLIAEHVYPADEMSTIMKALVDKQPGNIIFWQGYIEATQCSMAHCSTPVVLDMYKKCLANLHQIRRNAVGNKSEVEAKILSMLYQCGLFLRQAGLWEQLWSLLRLYLELNLADDNASFNVESAVVEKELVELEEVVLKSNLPSHELWLRIEKLREACHWLPWTGDNDGCEDPQRVVFTEDVSELIHPITCPGNKFRLTALVFTLLKIPLLPCRHTTMHDLGLDYVPWALDALELFLPMFYPVSTIPFSIKHIFMDMILFLVGPQYVRSHPGQEEYLTFVTEVLKRCAYNFDGTEQIVAWTWWFAYIRLMFILDREQIVKLSAQTKKQFKTNIKILLKTSENRNNLIYFRKYAVIEYEQGNCAQACKILITAIQSQNNSLVTGLEQSLNKASLCLLYRTLTEFLISNSKENCAAENIQKAIGVLICLALGTPITLESTFESNTNSTGKALEKFQITTNQLLTNDLEKLSPIEHFLPDFATNWFICHGWFLYFIKSTFDCGAFIEMILSNVSISRDLFRQELLYEFYVGILYRHCLESHGSGIYDLLNQVLSRAIKLYPNNLYFLATYAQIENIAGGIGRPWWKVNELLTATNHCIPRLFLIVLMVQRMTQYEKAQKLAVETFGGPYLEDPSYKNRMFSLFHKLTNTNSVSKRCGLIWRLYLKFLYHNSTSEACRNAYYAACEECPWLKALYIDAAIYIPTELPQIQDLLVEKQLRIHLTPEELEILRN